MNKTTTKTPITGHYDGTVLDLVEPFRKNSPETFDRALRLAPLYLKYDRKFNIRADIAWGQMIHETGYLYFKGIAKPEWNNFCGLGVTGPTAIQTFTTEDLGVLAHFVHLCWYVYPDHVNTLCGRTYDPRHFETAGKHHPKFNGDTSIGRLGAAWAVPGLDYADKIVNYVNIVNKTVSESLEGVVTTDVEKEPLIVDTKYDIVVQMGHVNIYKGSTGTPGEREWNKKLGDAMEPLLKASGLNYKIIDGIAPEQPIKCKAFLSLHCDGVNDPKPDWYTMGFKPGTPEDFKEAMGRSWGNFSRLPRGKDNSTRGIQLYYMWTKKSEYKASKFDEWRIIADYYCLIEHGFFTNPTDRKWLESHIPEIAKHHVGLINSFLKG